MRTINLRCFPHGGLAALVVLMGLLMTSSGAFAQKSAAFLLPGSINDQSWNSEGFKSTERFKELGWNVTYSENVQAADMVESMRQYARKGVDVVVGHSGRFLSAAQRVGPEFPKTLFLIGSGATGSGKNVASIEYDNAQFGYLMGVLAARMSKTNKIGAISGLEGLPTVTAQVGAFRKGAISVRPNMLVKPGSSKRRRKEVFLLQGVRWGTHRLRRRLCSQMSSKNGRRCMPQPFSKTRQKVLAASI